MKFIADQNPKKVRIFPETDEEVAWVATLSEGSKRVKRGAERFVLKAFQEWRRNPTKLDMSGLASAMMGGPKLPTPTKYSQKSEIFQNIKPGDRAKMIYAHCTGKVLSGIVLGFKDVVDCDAIDEGASEEEATIKGGAFVVLLDEAVRPRMKRDDGSVHTIKEWEVDWETAELWETVV
jgi:hypothetical protein